MVDKECLTLSIVRQAELIVLSRATLYYQPKIDEAELNIMRALDQVYTKHPFYGSRRLRLALCDEYQISICREQVQRLMRQMGIQAIYPKKRTTIPNPEHKKYPYLLKNLEIIRPNQVWSTAITYIPLEKGFCYLLRWRK